MSSGTHNTDSLLQQLGGCGIFQIAISCFASCTYVSSAFTMMFMIFGSYNPGWRCLDNATTTNSTTTYNNASNNNVGTIYAGEYGEKQTASTVSTFTDSCHGFAGCTNVQFNPDSSSIVTEWGLICDHSWKVSVIISIQMAGMTLGHFLSGYLGDTYGRRLTLNLNVAILIVLTLLSIASVSWEMFAVIRFFLGVVCGAIFCVAGVYMTEFVTPKWRAIIPSLPMWSLGCCILSLCALTLKDWKHIHIFNCVFTSLCLIPTFVFPESLRWLIINKKEKKSFQAVSRIAQMNRIDLPAKESLSRLVDACEKSKKKTKNIFSFIRLFHKGSRRNTCVISSTIIVSNIVYFSTSFGMSTIPGDIYINNIIIYIMEMPSNVVAWFAPNLFGRKPTVMVACFCQCITLITYTAFDMFATGNVKENGVLVSVIIAKNCCNILWFLSVVCTNELFPTVIRAVAIGWIMFVSGIASIITPYLTISESVKCVSFITTAVLSFVCGLMFVLLPETAGIDLKDEADPTEASSTLEDNREEEPPRV